MRVFLLRPYFCFHFTPKVPTNRSYLNPLTQLTCFFNYTLLAFSDSPKFQIRTSKWNGGGTCFLCLIGSLVYFLLFLGVSIRSISYYMSCNLCLLRDPSRMELFKLVRTLEKVGEGAKKEIDFTFKRWS